MTKFLLMTAAAFVTVAASPVVARDARPATPTETTAADRTQTPTPTVKKYCVMDETTGSRVARKTCKTREAWLAEGFDPLVKQ